MRPSSVLCPLSSGSRRCLPDLLNDVVIVDQIRLGSDGSVARRPVVGPCPDARLPPSARVSLPKQLHAYAVSRALNSSLSTIQRSSCSHIILMTSSLTGLESRVCLANGSVLSTYPLIALWRNSGAPDIIDAAPASSSASRIRRRTFLPSESPTSSLYRRA